MTDSASRSLLTSGNVRVGKRTTYKLPLSILFLLSLLIGTIAASIAILLASHKDSVKAWKVRPAILLSIVAGLYIVLLGGLFTIGVAVVWWRSIIHGTTLKRLHFINAGASPEGFIPAFIAGGHARRVALAALVAFSAKLAIGPMLQRSTTPEIQVVTTTLDMDINLAHSIPSGWFGDFGVAFPTGINMSRATLLGEDIKTANATGYNCPSDGTCDASVLGSGINFGCRTTTQNINLTDPKSVNSTLFGIDLIMDYNASLPILYLESKFVSDISDNCMGTLTTETCNMIPATMWYNISIRDDIITPNFTAAYMNPAILSNDTSQGDEQSKDPKAPIGTLKGIEGALRTKYQSGAVLSFQDDGSRPSYLPEKTAWAPFWADVFKFETPPQYPESVAQKCPFLWHSPTEMVMGGILEFLFRSAIEVARSDDKHKQPFKAQYKGEDLRYATNFCWFAASVAVMVIGIAAVLPLLFGWWQLRRYTTLSPLETGRVFGGPIFASAGPEKEAKFIIKEVGHERVAYDGDELVWSGSVYATGAGGSLRNRSREPGMSEMEGDSSGNSSLRGKGHRRGGSSISDASPVQVQARRPSFEHNLGFTTRRPYDDEEEIDIGQYGRPRANSHGNDISPLIPMPLSVTHGGSPSLPPIPPSGSIRMEPMSPCGRMRRGSRCAADAAGMGRRPLSKIDERSTPSPEGSRRL